MKQQIKELRVKIDGLAQLTEQLNPVFPKDNNGKFIHSREIEKSIDNLYLAKAWLGKVLGELGVETPYANDGKRKSVEDIEPTTDVCEETPFDFIQKSHIEKVDYLRQEIQKVIEELFDIKTSGAMLSFKNNINTTNAYNYLCEARFWLGFELSRCRDEK